MGLHGPVPLDIDVVAIFQVSGFQEILLMMHSAVAIATSIFLLAVFLSGHTH